MAATVPAVAAIAVSNPHSRIPAMPGVRAAALAVLCACLAPGMASPAAAQSSSTAQDQAASYRAAPAASPDVPALVARLLPSVVNISTVRYESAQGEPRTVPAARRRSLGSGFVIDPAGMILTNRHVIENADEITVTFSDGTSLGATVAAAAGVDIALLRVQSSRPLPVVRWGNSAALRQGMPVLAIGNPLGYGSSVSMGIVSALERDIASSPYDDYIQTDAPINPGSSGGPLFNLAGEVVGVNTAISTTSATSGSIGIAFAIPSNDARFVVERLLQFDRVRVGWLPVTVHKTTAAVAEAVGLPALRGVIVTGLVGAHASLGTAVAPGDVILSVDGAPVHDTRTFNRAVGVLPVGTIAALVLWRDGREAIVKVEIGDNPDEMRRAPIRTARETLPAADGPDLGLNLAALTGEARTRLKLPDGATGLLVTQVESLSTAAEQGLLPGDAILMVQRKPVRSVRDFWVSLEHARAEGRGRILLLIRNANGLRWVALSSH